MYVSKSQLARCCGEVVAGSGLVVGRCGRQEAAGVLVCSSGVPVLFRLWLLGAVEVLSHVVESGFCTLVAPCVRVRCCPLMLLLLM